MTVRFIVCLFLLSSVPSAVLGGDAMPLPPNVCFAYHRFASERTDTMAVRTDTLRARLRTIEATGYQIVPLADVVRWHAGEAGAILPSTVSITIDYGHRSVYEVLRPVLAQHPVPVTLFNYPSAISDAS